MTIEIPGYKIRHSIGKGGMASVYLAEQEIFERDVALKVMSRALADDPSFGQRFFREAKIVSQLVHPNIVTVYDVGVKDKTFYLSMEYIDGGDLKSRRKNFSFAQKVRAIRDIARALDYAGNKGYVHRDIKPENIMFHNVDNRAVLMDFGIARAAETDASMTQTGTAIGTPHYMSPEQAKGKPVDPRSDLYSLGVVFFLLIAGSVPYDAESAVAIGIKHITEPIPLLPRGYEELQSLIDKMMAKRPEDRFQSGKALLSALTRIDIPRIESRIKKVTQAERDDLSNSNTDAATMLTPAVSGVRPIPRRPVAAGNEDPEGDDDEFMDSKPAFVSFEDDDFDYGKAGSWGAWIAGVLVAFVVASFVFFHQKPELAQPWLERTESTWVSVSNSTKSVVDDVQRWFAGLTDNTEKKTPKSLEVLDTKPVDLTAPPKESASSPKRTVTSADKLVEVGSSDDIEASVGQPNGSLDNEAAAPALDTSPAIEAMRAQLTSLLNGFFGEREKLPELVDAHRALLANIPGDKQTLESLTQLKNDEIERIKNHVDIGETAEASKRLLQLKYLFPEVTTKAFSRLESLIAKQEKVLKLLGEAEALYAINALTLPKKNSALARYQQVLTLDAKNKTAKAGLIKIASQLAANAETQFNSGAHSKAQLIAKKALAIDGKNVKAKRVLLKLEGAADAKRLRLEQLENGRRRLFSGDLFEPETNSAYYYYSQVLNSYPNDKDAVSGIDDTLEALSSRVWRLVGEGRFAQAQAELVRPKRLMGKTARLTSLELAVEEVIAEKQRATPN